MLFMASAGAYGQVTVVPSVSVSETLTDNVRLTSVGQQSEQITEISAGVRINIEVEKLKSYFDYSLSEVVYAQNTSPNRSQFNNQNALNTFGTLEAIDNWAFVDFNGSISQQTVSAFDTQSIDNTAINANKAEVANYRLSPYVRGRLGDMASYEARYSRSVTNSDTAEGSGVSMVDGSVRLSGASAFRNLGWSADGSRQTVNYSAGRPTENDRLSFGLSYSITPQLSIFSNVGRESNNYTSIEKKSYGTSGF
ncbi:MAG: TIGR03016 family PEP-CTERM system-associated outer membrane protein, partial [Gallionella sp.]|nr:TIGR03016 family PEP-CTERM system-associated outer membrane protein [Gallionella sp.]